MAKIVPPPLEDSMTITVDFGELSVSIDNNSITLRQHSEDGQEDIEIETNFQELREIVDIVSASVLCDDDDDDD